MHGFSAPIRITSRTNVDDLLKAQCSVCTWKGNKSAYWFPTLYFRYTNGTEIELEPFNVPAYYVMNTSSTSEQINLLPNGLKIVSGNNHNNFRVVIKAGRNLTTETIAVKYGSFPENVNGAQTVSLIINTPECMKNALTLDSPDHKSHMAYTVNNRCPEGYPYRVPSVSLHPAYRLPEVRRWKSWKTIPLRLGTEKIYGSFKNWHVDYIAAWDQSHLWQLMKFCGNTTADECRAAMEIRPRMHKKLRNDKQSCPVPK